MKNKTLIIAAAATAGALLGAWLLNRRKEEDQAPKEFSPKKSHHLTDVFAHAKAHSEQ